MSVRTASRSGIYHVMMRGVNKCAIFIDDADRKTFLSYLGGFRRNFNITLYCYCLMDNHVHLLIRDNDGNLSDAMHFLNMHYSMYFNEKYERVGHLFQSRFKSIPVETRNYFYSLIRYILLNPRKAYGCEPSDYRWSSFRDYMYGYSTTDTGTLLAEVGGKSGFLKIMAAHQENDPENCEFEEYVSDEEAASIITSILKMDPKLLAKMCSSDRNDALRMLKKNRLSNRQISIYTGVSRSTIQRALSRTGSEDPEISDTALSLTAGSP